jgi:hypothetical protein
MSNENSYVKVGKKELEAGGRAGEALMIALLKNPRLIHDLRDPRKDDGPPLDFRRPTGRR